MKLTRWFNLRPQFNTFFQYYRFSDSSEAMRVPTHVFTAEDLLSLSTWAGTAKITKRRQLLVTYHGQALYVFPE